MLRTCEIRWFFDQLPVELERIVTDETELQERTDWYIMPANPECGIKVREGNLEMKLRCASYGLREFGELSGHLEIWKKWSLPFDAECPPSLEELAGTHWIDIDKKRYLQRFEVKEDRVTTANQRPDNGCEFEVTELVLEGKSYWTVGFEAVGPLIELERNLQLVSQEIVSRRALRARFTPDESYGYAAWLSRLVIS